LTPDTDAIAEISLDKFGIRFQIHGMAANSNSIPLGTKAPDFKLPDVTGKTISLADLRQSSALVVVFMCNHCPYVKHIAKGLVSFAKNYMNRGVAMVGINSNDASRYPDDSPERMAEIAKAEGYLFHYLYDQSQSVAKAYRAACTPDIYLFDADQKLVYHGQFDDSRPGNDAQVSGKDLMAAVDAVLTGKPVPQNQKPSVGCSIKWKPGNEPAN
jgi:peroxiredoxin